MKKRTFLNVALAIFIFSAVAFESKTGKVNAKNIGQEYVQISDNFFLGKYEVSNAEYKKFMVYLRQSGNNDLYKNCLWDTTQWLINNGNEPLTIYYHSHDSYNNYPVVTISYNAANEYCKWLTQQYNADANRKFKKVVFRLPSQQEWTNAATAGKKNKMYPWDMYYLRNKKGEFLCNYRHLGDESITYDAKTKSYSIQQNFTDRPVLPTKINSFYPSTLGLYNMSGNAAEMVSEKGLAMGGSYNDPGHDVTTSSKKYYNSPSTEIGFRVAMEVVEK